jgi:hypothetical protein
MADAARPAPRGRGAARQGAASWIRGARDVLRGGARVARGVCRRDAHPEAVPPHAAAPRLSGRSRAPTVARCHRRIRTRIRGKRLHASVLRPGPEHAAEPDSVAGAKGGGVRWFRGGRQRWRRWTGAEYDPMDL